MAPLPVAGGPYFSGRDYCRLLAHSEKGERRDEKFAEDALPEGVITTQTPLSSFSASVWTPL